MFITDSSKRRIEKQNRYMHSELGNPQYMWVWSEDLKWPFQVMEFSDGPQEYAIKWLEKHGADKLQSPEFMEHCARLSQDAGPLRRPKLQERILPSGLIVKEPVYELFHILPMHRSQWVLCRKVTSVYSQMAWHRMFGSAMPFPADGQLVPCCGALGPVAIERGKEPSLSDTEEVIKCIRAERSRTAADDKNATEAGLAKKEADTFNANFDRFKDAAPAFGGVPGDKGHWVQGGTKDLVIQGTL
jgi:hypothetical protein